MKLKKRVFDAHTRELQRASNDARDLAAADLGARSARAIAALSRVDTGRTRRAYEQASNALPGTRTVALSPLRESRFSRTLRVRIAEQAERLTLRVEKQAAFVEAVKAQYFQTLWPSRLEMLEQTARRLEALTKARDRAIDLLATIDASPDTAPLIVIGGRRRRRGSRSYLGTLARPIFRVYGGEGRLIREGRRSVAQVKNREPHASLVERRDRVVAAVLAGFRRNGLRASRGGGYFARVLRAADRVGRQRARRGA